MKRDESNRVYWFQTRLLSVIRLFVGCFNRISPALSAFLESSRNDRELEKRLNLALKAAI